MGLNCWEPPGFVPSLTKPSVPDSELGIWASWALGAVPGCGRGWDQGDHPKAFHDSVMPPSPQVSGASLPHLRRRNPGSPALLPFHELPVGEDLHVQGQFDVHELLVLPDQLSHVLLAALQGLLQPGHLGLGVPEGPLPLLAGLADVLLQVQALRRGEGARGLGEAIPPLPRYPPRTPLSRYPPQDTPAPLSPRTHLALLGHDAGPQFLDADVQIRDFPPAVEEVPPEGAGLGAAVGELRGEGAGVPWHHLDVPGITWITWGKIWGSFLSSLAVAVPGSPGSWGQSHSCSLESWKDISISTGRCPGLWRARSNKTPDLLSGADPGQRLIPPSIPGCSPSLPSC